MPIFVTQWRDGDVSLTAAATKEEAQAIFQTMACLDPEDILELQSPTLSVHLTLSDDGSLVVDQPDEAIEEVRQTCYPEVVKALRGFDPSVLSRTNIEADPDVKRAVWDAMKVRKVSQLSRRLRRESKPE